MFVYLIGNDCQQKIGYSKCPNKRLKSLQTANHSKLKIHYAIEVPNEKAARKIESLIHKEHNHLRIKGEWFDMPMKEAINMMAYQEIMLETNLAKA